jgi:hypothetical protein
MIGSVASVTITVAVSGSLVGALEPASGRGKAGNLTTRSKEEAGATSTPADSRLWHVAPAELRGLPLDAQVRTISEAAAKAEPSDTVLIHAGIYREAVTVAKSGTRERPIRFQATPGEVVVVTGADAIRQWKKEPGGKGVFSTAWPHRFITGNKQGTHPDDDEHIYVCPRGGADFLP